MTLSHKHILLHITQTLRDSLSNDTETQTHITAYYSDTTQFIV